MPTRADIIQQATNQFPSISPRAALAAAWIERYCTVETGDGFVPFVLLPFQLEILDGVYPGLPYEERIIRRAFISMARKNGKTELCSALTLLHLAGPEAGVGTQIVNAAAANQKQASLVFDGAVRMAMGHDALRPKFTNRINRLTYDLGGVNNYAMTISTKPSSAQGLRPAFWTYDEIAETTSRGLYEALNLAQTNVSSGGLGMIISTRSTNPLSMFTVIDEEITQETEHGGAKHWYRRIWSADPTSKNLYSMDEVLKANPAAGTIIPISVLEQDLATAIASDSARPEFRARRLNIETGSNAALVDPAKWGEAAMELIPRDELWEAQRNKSAVISMDLGNSKSLTALGIYWPEDRIFSGVSFMASNMVKTLSALHKVPYQDHADKGRLVLVEPDLQTGMKYDTIAEYIARMFEMFDIKAFRYDKYKKWAVWDKLKDMGLHYEQSPMKHVIFEFRQGALSYGEAIDTFEDLMTGADTPILRHDNDPVTNMSVSVCQVETTVQAVQSMRRPVKNASNYPNDAAVCLLMCLANEGINFEKKKVTERDVDDMYEYFDEEESPESDDKDDPDIFY